MSHHAIALALLAAAKQFDAVFVELDEALLDSRKTTSVTRSA
jgi:hypothetical protein